MKNDEQDLVLQLHGLLFGSFTTSPFLFLDRGFFNTDDCEIDGGFCNVYIFCKMTMLM